MSYGKFRCTEDYYNCLVSGKSADTFYREDREAAQDRRDEEERTRQDMIAHYALYGD